MQLALYAGMLAQRLGRLPDQRRRGVVGGTIRPFARIFNTHGKCRCDCELRLHGTGVGHTHRDAGQCRHLRLRFGGRVDIAGLRHGAYRGANGTRLTIRGKHQRCALDGARFQRSPKRLHRLAHRMGVTLAAAQQHQPARRHLGRRIQREMLARLQLQVSLLERGGNQDGQGIALRLEPFGHQQYQQITFVRNSGGQ